MTRNGFILLMLTTVVAIFIGATVAERYTDEGFGRTLMVGAIAAAIVFPVSWLAEKFGLVKGKFDPSKLGAPQDGEGRDIRGGDQK
ncbi:MAG: hypothetical protein ABS55_08695 [Lautropia sp. SCN 70-15]|mgnify:CR=1 FL=1|jgi:hypothetical protein|nr:MAG: hypothetical protein ABS55_08695 [Lautropia sp. SCN 70-15]